jgi:hypothetical protein
MSIVLGIDVTEVSTTPTHALGSLGQTNVDGTKEYRYVQYDTGAGAVAAVSGQVAYYYLAGGTDDYKVTSDLSDSVNVGAGVLQSAPTDGQYCWIQVRGKATLTIALTAGSDGNALTPVGATDGTLDVSAAVTDHVCAIADDISAKEIVCYFP